MTAKDEIEIFKTAETANKTLNEAIGLVMKSLKKQVPFKPTRFKERKEYNCKFGDCKCGALVIDAYGYCSKCGQALDWSDTELSKNADTAFQDGLDENRDLFKKEVEPEIRNEAIKEFAERLRNKIWYSDWCNFEKPITPEIITNLVQEMTEEK